MDSNLSKGKRKRGSMVHESQADNDEDLTSLRLHNLPDVGLRCVASFLPFKHKVMLVLALPTWEFTPTHDLGKTILGGIDTIDFGDLDNARTLTDDDLNRILLSIDAVNNLKVLKLTHCVQIEGRGLESLRGSNVLEKIDLSLLPRFYENKAWLGGVSLSLRAVLPILNSIVATDGCQLKYIQFHSSLCKLEDATDVFDQFVSRYNHLAIRCESCNVDDATRGFSGAGGLAHRGIPLFSHDASYNIRRTPGLEIRTCYECERHLCNNCNRSRNHPWGVKITSCAYCEKTTCDDCCHVHRCTGCRRPVCAGCVENKDCIRCNLCPNCTILACEGCGVASCKCLLKCCDNCETKSCEDCRIVSTCDQCDEDRCEDCGCINGCGNCPNYCDKCEHYYGPPSLDCLECLSKWKAYHVKRANEMDDLIASIGQSENE